MPSDSPPRPSNSGRERPRLSHDPQHASAHAAAPERRWRDNPRVLAALCYVIPYVASVVALSRERRNRFVRVHASQALLFFVTIPIAQTLLFAALIAVGNSVGAGPWSVAFGVVFLGAFLALGGGALLLWLRLLVDCWAGRATVYPIIGALAQRLERMLVRGNIARSRPLGQNDDTP